MRMMILIALVLSYQSAGAEVYKCIGKGGKTVYQAKPCQNTDKAQQLDIQADPAKEAEAKVKAEALRNEYQVRKAARLEEERKEAERQNQVEQTNALRQSAAAEQQQAVAQERQAEALERQNRWTSSPLFAIPPSRLEDLEKR